MKFEADKTEGLALHSYGSGWFLMAQTVAKGEPPAPLQRYEHGVALYPSSGLIALHADNLVSLEAESVNNAALQAALAEAEVLLIGAGANHPQMPLPVRKWLTQICAKHGIGFEVMSTPAACRTYNILKAEGRKVAAWLLVV